MVTAIAVWSLVVPPVEDGKEPLLYAPPADVRITGMALGDELTDESARTTIKLTYQEPVPSNDEDEEEEDEDDDDDEGVKIHTTVLGSLTPGKIEQAVVDLILEAGEDYIFEIVGKNTIYLTGNYIEQAGFDNPPYDDSDDDFDDEDAYDLDEVSSDVAIDAMDIEAGLEDDSEDEDAGRFEEVLEAPVENKKKRERESDASDAAALGKLTKAERKKLKKLKGANGEAVPAGEAAAPKAKEAKKDDEKKDKKPAGKVVQLEGGVTYRDSKLGTGPQAKAGQTVTMRYVGKLQNGTIFDKNTAGAPFKFKLGKGEVIKGWDVGIVGMAVGGERELTVPPKAGYGNKKSGPIPPNSTLIFETKLLGIK